MLRCHRGVDLHGVDPPAPPRLQPLGTATCLIFFTCGLGHATHVEHYLEQADFYAAMPDLWHQALTDSLTVFPAVTYLTLRRRYGLCTSPRRCG